MAATELDCAVCVANAVLLRSGREITNPCEKKKLEGIWSRHLCDNCQEYKLFEIEFEKPNGFKPQKRPRRCDKLTNSEYIHLYPLLPICPVCRNTTGVCPEIFTPNLTHNGPYEACPLCADNQEHKTDHSDNLIHKIDCDCLLGKPCLNPANSRYRHAPKPISDSDNSIKSDSDNSINMAASSGSILAQSSSTISQPDLASESWAESQDSQELIQKSEIIIPVIQEIKPIKPPEISEIQKSPVKPKTRKRFITTGEFIRFMESEPDIKAILNSDHLIIPDPIW